MRLMKHLVYFLLMLGILNSCGLVRGVAKPILRTVGAAGRVITGG
jgi:hypothetical protein